ncbi:MAG TPA: vWA domain-containing protein [Aestuariivirga sp.]|nr:vWA domain-containing protein [Aestuariivirga sp.]
MLALVHKLQIIQRKLAKQTGGNVSILFALAALPLLLAAGMAIDYLRAARVQTELQAALDSAALAAAMAEPDGPDKQKSAGVTYFKSNFATAGFASVEPTITVNKTTVIATATLNYPTAFMGLAGIESMEIGGFAEVEPSKENNVEVVLVLDYSGSMEDNDKYIRMRDAAGKMVSELTAGAKDSTRKFGIVPFSAMVRTSMPAAYVTQAAAGPTWTGCTQDRKAPYNTGVSTPTSNDDTKWGYIDDNGSENAAPKYDCAVYEKNKVTIMPLTSDIAAVQARLKEMSPVGNTNIPLGAEFGWNLLDPDLPFSEGAPYDDAKTKKFLVLLTDGVQTSRHWGEKGNRSVDNGNDNLKTVCANMAKKGITIFSVAYDIKAAAVTKLLQACAPDNYFESDKSGGEIEAVFNAITARIQKSLLRLTQ